LNVTRFTVGADNDRENDGAILLDEAGGFGILRIDFRFDSRRLCAGADFEDWIGGRLLIAQSGDVRRSRCRGERAQFLRAIGITEDFLRLTFEFLRESKLSARGTATNVQVQRLLVPGVSFPDRFGGLVCLQRESVPFPDVGAIELREM
jgi:hypothetical protein